jgi:uncharacterized repeat protein (TIGR03803 family)
MLKVPFESLFSAIRRYNSSQLRAPGTFERRFPEATMFTSKLSSLVSFSVLAAFALICPLGDTAFAQHEKVLYTFSGTGGALPMGTLVTDAAGNLYGSTQSGGTKGAGVVFKLVRAGGGWVETVLHNFTGSNDGGGPQTPLVVDSAGNVYGTAYFGGGSNLGVVFELSPSASGWTEKVLHSFGSISGDAAAPYTGLAADTTGNLYGTTTIAAGGYGAVFELSRANGSGWNYSVIHTFGGHTSDGAIPYSSVVFGQLGNLYGMTEQGGAFGAGTVFSMSLSASGWDESVIYNFKGGSDGEAPFGNLTLGSAGRLYGTTLLGGADGQGTAFELTLEASGEWSGRVIHSFGSFTGDGLSPASTLGIDAAGNLLGTTSLGGARNAGTIFELKPDGASFNERLVLSFSGPANSNPQAVGNVILEGGSLYGVGPGGATRAGVVFEVTP